MDCFPFLHTGSFSNEKMSVDLVKFTSYNESKRKVGLRMNGTNLLIVDDEQMIRNGLKHSIPWESIGVNRVFTAEDSYGALRICEENMIQIVITDICMPEIDGLELSKRLKYIYPAMQIIMLSGKAEFEYARQSMRLGAVDYLLKPIDVKELMKCVENAVIQFHQVQKKLEEDLQNLIGLSGEQNILAVSGCGTALHDRLFSRDSDVKKSTEGFSSVMKKAVDYINLNFRKSLSAQGMAEQVGLSKNYFSTQFKKEVGISFIEYLNRVRIYQAKRLLKDTNYMTYEIAEAVGYSNYNYFSTVFKSMTGIAPSEYRKADI